MNFDAATIATMAATLVAGAALAWPRLRRAERWHAIVTPLASIIGSGFLVLAPLLGHHYGRWAVAVMSGLCLVAYLFGAAIRYNIGQRTAGATELSGVEALEQLASGALAFAYIISVAYYLNLFGAFAVRLTPIDSGLAGRSVTTAALAFIGLWGWWHGLKGLERAEQLSVSIKLAVIAGLLGGLAVFTGDQATAGQLHFPPATEHGWAALTLGFGLVITVQGFETSRYLEDAYDADTRVRTMRYAQWLATAIYLAYIGMISMALDVAAVELSETAIIDLSREVAGLLPPLLVAAALAAQFSAAVADTIGCGGMAEDASGGRVSGRHLYVGVAAAGIGLTWTAHVFEIISYASRAFALYYALQCLIAARIAIGRGHRARAAGWALLVVLGLAILVFGRAVE